LYLWCGIHLLQSIWILSLRVTQAFCFSCSFLRNKRHVLRERHRVQELLVTPDTLSSCACTHMLPAPIITHTCGWVNLRAHLCECVRVFDYFCLNVCLRVSLRALVCVCPKTLSCWTHMCVSKLCHTGHTHIHDYSLTIIPHKDNRQTDQTQPPTVALNTHTYTHTAHTLSYSVLTFNRTQT